MMGDAAKFWGLTALLALCVLATDAGPCFCRTGEPAPVILLAAGPAKHVIKAGETINLLALRYGVPAAAIVKANPGLNPARLQLGKEILIPTGGRATEEPVAPAAPKAAPSGLELRPEKAPQATQPIVAAPKGHDLPDSPGKAPAPPQAASSAKETVQPKAETPKGPEEVPAAEVAGKGVPAVKDVAPQLPIPSVAVEKVGDRTRIAVGGRGFFADQIVPWALGLGSRLFSAVLMLVGGLWVSGKLAGLLARMLGARRVPSEIVSFAGSLARYGLYLVVLIACLGQLGFNVGSLLALFGAAGLAVSLALKDTLSNFASGIMLLLVRFFRVGDRVSLPGVAGAVGVVVSIDIFSTIIRSDAGNAIIIPNSKIAGNIIVVGSGEEPAEK